MTHPEENIPVRTAAGELAVGSVYQRNRWLIRIRWIYAFFILLFFGFHHFVFDRTHIAWNHLVAILLLTIAGNVVFLLFSEKPIHRDSDVAAYRRQTAITAWQLSFDLLVLALLAYFSNGFQSPLIVLFILYVFLGAFVAEKRKSFRYTLAAILLITFLFFAGEGFPVESQRLAAMLAFNLVLVLAHFLSSFILRSIRENENIMHELLEKTRELSITDGLTKLHTQSHFFELLRQEFERSRRHGFAFSVIIFDVDHFKAYNDANGHIRGSQALTAIARIMKEVFRVGDILAKYGGDEFVVILPHTDKVGAFLAADRLRETVQTSVFAGEKTQPGGTLTLSLGIASYPDHGGEPEEILASADRALYQAKKMGRNRTVIFGEDVLEIP